MEQIKVGPKAKMEMHGDTEKREEQGGDSAKRRLIEACKGPESKGKYNLPVYRSCSMIISDVVLYHCIYRWLYHCCMLFETVGVAPCS